MAAPSDPDRVPVSSSGEHFVRLGQIKLCYETFGSEDAPPLLLVMGLGSQMVLWHDELCEQLAERGFWAIRFDNRDVGRSSILRDAPIPSQRQLILRDPRGASYSLEQMADDTAGLLDQLEVRQAHVVGASMGGMIAQWLAIRHPERVSSLVSIMSSTGSRKAGQTHPRLYLRMLRRPRMDREGYIEDFVATFKAIGSRRYPGDPEETRALAARCFERGLHPAGSARQLAAVLTASDRTPLLRQLDVPTTVIHGDADPLVMPSGGRATAEAIPGARLAIIPGMGHGMPRVLWPRIVQEIVDTAARAGWTPATTAARSG
ncbi:MAG: alpha/beta fold hydrolase [Solirubrobacterales bacterium]|nr:alpha/beta fold hydrolase [Solirubrobacterales bacterium]